MIVMWKYTCGCLNKTSVTDICLQGAIRVHRVHRVHRVLFPQLERLTLLLIHRTHNKTIDCPCPLFPQGDVRGDGSPCGSSMVEQASSGYRSSWFFNVFNGFFSSKQTIHDIKMETKKIYHGIVFLFSFLDIFTLIQ